MHMGLLGNCERHTKGNCQYWLFTLSIDSNPTKIRLYPIPPLCQALHYALGKTETNGLSL